MGPTSANVSPSKPAKMPSRDDEPLLDSQKDEIATLVDQFQETFSVSPPPCPAPKRPPSTSPKARNVNSPLPARTLQPTRNILPDDTLEAVANFIQQGKARRIVVMSGAGISTAAGIPDFRTPGTGLYDNLQKFDLPYAEAIFDIDYFLENPQPFYALAKELYPGCFQPTLSHYFIRLLAEKNLLLRHFTQNIDTLERVASIPPEYLVEAHGSFHTAHCVRRSCRQEFSQDWVKKHIDADTLPLCTTCKHPKGLVKPDITFFGEPLPSRFFQRSASDLSKCDLLIVMGTSLQVQPFASLIDRVPAKVPRLLINLERCGDTGSVQTGFDFSGTRQKYRRDALYLGTCDSGCLRLADSLGWKDELLAMQSSANEKIPSSLTTTDVETLDDITLSSSITTNPDHSPRPSSPTGQILEAIADDLMNKLQLDGHKSDQ
ncbi:hypothetical protein IWQ62_002670 [Dispira parvispora]|uniref:Deacetylase sirtuin-type domain-containing protein n=1 Tax=Dispira parvispora TaxID=1520584 RepID=A0A9W8AVA3_9FUNG|nr:hypothetical protein IWQ62_002670 [Dispira parvispora]